MMCKKKPALIFALPVFRFLDQIPTLFEPIFIYWTVTDEPPYKLDIIILNDSQVSYL